MRNRDKAICQFCSKELAYCWSTSYFCDHFNRIHQKDYHPPRSNQATIESYISTARVKDFQSDTLALIYQKQL